LEPDLSRELGLVVIGRNEGERLRRCLESLPRGGARAVYVDSGSTDGSPSLARSLGLDVVELDTATPFTAARARNAGVERLRQLVPDIKAVQFVDGDCELVPGWLERGFRELIHRPEAGGVFGNVRELFPHRSIYNRLCDMEWKVPMGEVEASGGIVLLRVDALDRAGGFDASAIAAEDTELCARIRQAGWKIFHLDAEMVRHDAAMLKASQWWKRAVRAGYAYTHWSRPRRGAVVRLFTRDKRRVIALGFLLPAAALSLLFITRGLSLILLLVYPALYFRVYRQARRQGEQPGDAGLFAINCVLVKFPQMVGVVRYNLDRWGRKPAKIIEHKRLAAAVPKGAGESGGCIEK
jgi:GT2 family glycosyltransferase